MSWRIEVLNETVAAEIAGLPEDMQARFLQRAERIASTMSQKSLSGVLRARHCGLVAGERVSSIMQVHTAIASVPADLIRRTWARFYV